jgi:hypothetical protein
MGETAGTGPRRSPRNAGNATTAIHDDQAANTTPTVETSVTTDSAGNTERVHAEQDTHGGGAPFPQANNNDAGPITANSGQTPVNNTDASANNTTTGNATALDLLRSLQAKYDQMVKDHQEQKKENERLQAIIGQSEFALRSEADRDRAVPDAEHDSRQRETGNPLRETSVDSRLTAVPRGAKLNKPDLFKGDARSVASFLVQVNMYTDMQPGSFVNDYAKVVFAGSYMTDTAKRWWTSVLNKDDKPDWMFSWVAFRHEMQHVFGHVDQQAEAAKQINMLRQMASAADYYARFLQYKYSAETGWNDAAQMYAFRKGLRTPWRYKSRSRIRWRNWLNWRYVWINGNMKGKWTRNTTKTIRNTRTKTEPRDTEQSAPDLHKAGLVTTKATKTALAIGNEKTRTATTTERIPNKTLQTQKTSTTNR